MTNAIVETCKVIATDMVCMQNVLKRLERQLRLLPSSYYDKDDMLRVRRSLKRLQEASKDFYEDLTDL